MDNQDYPQPAHPSLELLCFLCQDMLCNPQTTSCGHTFCYVCLDQYLIYSDSCPKCGKHIRNKTATPTPCIASFIEQLLGGDREELVKFGERKKAAKQYVRRRQMQTMKVGLVIDIRDANGIWCQGMITRVLSRPDQPVRSLRINYINYLQSREEDVPIGSLRVAPKGFFTGRKDIPHYGTKSVNPIITKYQI